MTDILIRSDEDRLLHGMALRLFGDAQTADAEVAEAGLLALPFAESLGGLHADDSEDRSALAVTFAAMGEADGSDHRLLQAVLGGTMAGTAPWPGREALVGAIIAGDEAVAAALHEPGARTDLDRCATRAERTASGWRIDGVKTLVIGAATATRLVLLARTGQDGADGGASLSLFLAGPDTPGIVRRDYALRDGTPASDLTFTGVELGEEALLARGGEAMAILDAGLSLLRLCLAAEASGRMRALLARCAAYTAERRQFGQPIGSFQVIQHRLADMAVAADQAEALVAAVAAAAGDRAAVVRAHRAVAELGMTAAKQAIQLHGGAGMTEDLPLGRTLRRMMTIALLL